MRFAIMTITRTNSTTPRNTPITIGSTSHQRRPLPVDANRYGRELGKWWTTLTYSKFAQYMVRYRSRCSRCCCYHQSHTLLHSDRGCWWHRCALDHIHRKPSSVDTQVGKEKHTLLFESRIISADGLCKFSDTLTLNFTILSRVPQRTWAGVVSVTVSTNITRPSILTRIAS